MKTTFILNHMKKLLFYSVMMVGFIFTSCSHDESIVPFPDAANNQINFTVTADYATRAKSAYQNGTAINKIKVSAWLTNDEKSLPGYWNNNTDNYAYFTNDILTREEGGTTGVFSYASNTRYWPTNGDLLSFFAVVDNDVWGDAGEFAFNAHNGVPGLRGEISQLEIHKMPDLLYAYTPNQKPTGAQQAQQNVNLKFDHAFAKVIVTAEVRNENLLFCIAEVKICGVVDEGQFLFPHKEQKDGEIVIQPAKWIFSNPGYIDIKCPIEPYNKDNPLQLGTRTKAKEYLVGGDYLNNERNKDLLVIPNSYKGRNGGNLIQTYIKLKCNAHNISNEAGFNSELDFLIFPEKNPDGSPSFADILIPIEFEWKMGTVNHYNIILDCGNAGSETTNPNDPALIRIGYEVEVNTWEDGETKDLIEYKK